MDTIEQLLCDVRLPRMVKVLQRFDESRLEDVPGELRRQLSRPEIRGLVRPGMRIALTCGSRGIDHYPQVIRETVQFLRSLGAQPFVIPAMGSHGGAIAEQQKEVCARMGVTEESVGCPIRATMDVVEIGRTEEGDPVYTDAFAAASDGIVVINRIKNHTAFRGRYESGLMKMMVIGLGKQKGAQTCHRRGYGHMARMIPMIGSVVLQKAPILFGVGLVENAYDKTCALAVLTKEEIPLREPELLEEAKKRLPRLCCGDADVLIVDWMGKNFSGCGMDSNITGRVHNPWAGEPRYHANKLAVLDLSAESGGHMHGMGAADVMNRRIFDKGNLDITYPNSITSTTLTVNKIPVMMKNDRLTVQCAIKTCNAEDPERPRVVRIPNTLHISEILVSECMAESLRGTPGLTVTDETCGWDFNEAGNLW